MAKILYGVMGNTHGHSMRTLSLITRIPEHEFHLIGGGRVPKANNGRYPILEVPVLRTRHKNQKLDLPATIWQIVCRVFQIPWICLKIHRVVKTWKPDLIISDREFFTPIYARITGRTCISVDHTHILKCCDYPIPPELKKINALTLLNDNLLFDFTRHNLIVSFFQPPLRDRPGHRNELYGSIVRPELDEVSPSLGDYIFVYLSVPEFPGLIEVLQKLSKPVILYGGGKEGVEGNITYRGYSQKQILQDLAASCYAVVNGGHNLISEALHFGKPVLCFPIAGLIEQYINVHFVRNLHFGDYTYDKKPATEIFSRFEANLDLYRKAVSEKYENGAPKLIARLKELFTQAEKNTRA